jgi:hypothetical protein
LPAAALKVTYISDAGSYSASLGRVSSIRMSQQTARFDDQAVAAAAYH